MCASMRIFASLKSSGEVQVGAFRDASFQKKAHNARRKAIQVRSSLCSLC